MNAICIGSPEAKGAAALVFPVEGGLLAQFQLTAEIHSGAGNPKPRWIVVNTVLPDAEARYLRQLMNSLVQL